MCRAGCQRDPSFHIPMGTPSQHRAHLGPSQAASPPWENRAAFPILPHTHPVTTGYCQIRDPVNLPGWNRQAKQAGTTPQEYSHPSSPCKKSPCCWENKATLISRYLRVRGPAPERYAGSQASCPTTSGRSALSAITYPGEEVARLGDSHQYPAKALYWEYKATGSMKG